MNVLRFISKCQIIPVIEIDDAVNAGPLGESLLQGGLALAEVTFRSGCAPEALRILSKEYPDMLLGAGTVFSVEQVKKAMDSGARFIVAPGLNRTVIEYCQKKNIVIFPGAITPTELQKALELGLKIIKFFPAEVSGGVNYLKSISAPFNTLKFIPTGGINGFNIMDYLGLEKVAACGCSWVAPKKLIAERKFAEITSLTKRAVDIINTVLPEGNQRMLKIK